MSILIEVSYGELIDKITILEIKVERIDDPDKVRNVSNELVILKDALATYVPPDPKVDELADQLRSINGHLWDVEDRLRKKEHEKKFDDEFIELARSVYFTNDHRAKIKRELNELLRSSVVEEKSYQPYTP
ncbi:MAG: hypothetical protein A2X71_02330 [Thiobacillus sp. GWE1_62_9]|nr:MAG: hypothetical protein A2X71_02330 [Thiobacillus sp. GWE1_62_9]